MRFPVFARRTNPSVDRPILRKSKSYIEQQVADGRADWVDPADPRKGIVCRELLYFGEREIAPMPGEPALPRVELPGLKFRDPSADATRQITRVFALWAARHIAGEKVSARSRSQQAAAVAPTHTIAPALLAEGLAG